MAKLYVCGRCGYRSHHKARCHSCGFMLEEECVKCYSAKGNCVCRFHGIFVSGKKARKKKGGRAFAAAAAAKKKKKAKAKKKSPGKK